MPKICTKNVPGVGEFTIRFSTRFFRFEIDPPDEVANKIKTHPFEMWTGASWNDVLKQIDEIAGRFLHTEKLIRKVIVIQLRTSESNFKTKQQQTLGKGVDIKETHDKIKDAKGFLIRWFVMEEFQFPYDRLQYKLLESNVTVYFENYDNLRNRLFPDSYGEIRILDYREDLHVFLKSLDASISDMVAKIVAYFDIDEKKFIQNFENTKLKLT